MLISHSVQSYAAASAVLTLEHQKQPVRALVDVTVVLERLGAEQTAVGAWVNVLGYITSISSSTSRDRAGGSMQTRCDVHVHALLLWSAGPVHVHKYEAAVAALQSHRQGPRDDSQHEGPDDAAKLLDLLSK